MKSTVKLGAQTWRVAIELSDFAETSSGAPRNARNNVRLYSVMRCTRYMGPEIPLDPRLIDNPVFKCKNVNCKM